MLVAGEDPCDPIEVDVVFVCEHTARPNAGRDRVTAVDTDALALEVLRRRHDLRVREDRAVVEAADEKHGQRGERLAVLLRAHVGGDRELADVVGLLAHHQAKSPDQRIDFLEAEVVANRRDGAILQGGVVALRAGNGAQRRQWQDLHTLR